MSVHSTSFGRWLRLSLVMAGSLGVLPLRATTYFVATNGSDANFGTNVAAPFQTLLQATGVMLAGDTCFIRGGVYHETLLPLASGTATYPITFTAYSNEVVTIDAADAVTGWTALSNGIYQASVNWDLGPGKNQIFVDGAIIRQAQFPNGGSTIDVLHPPVVTVSNDALNPSVLTSAAWGGKPDNYWVGCWFVGGLGESWAWQSARVVSSTGTTITVDPTTQTMSWWFTGSGTGYLWGQFNLLDADNEWFLQTNSTGNILYLRIKSSANPATHVVERKKRTWCVNYNSHNYITVRGLNLWAGAVNLAGNGNVLENCQAQFLSHYTIITDGYLEDGGAPQGGGVAVNGNQNTVRGCLIANTAGSGILTYGSSNLITRNTIYNTDYSGTYAASITLRGNADTVTFNTCYNSGRDIIRTEGIGSDIRFNDFYNPGLLCKDMGLVYSWGINGQGIYGQPTRIAYNWIHDNNHPTPAPLVYLDCWDANYQIDHNVCWNSGGDSGVRYNLPAVGIQIYNNTLFNCADVGANNIDCWPNGNPNPSFWTKDIDQHWCSNNLYLAYSPQQQLVNWAARDFRLKTNAPAIDAGLPIPGVTDGYLGSKPDLGAYEFGSPAWSAGTNSRPTLTVSRAANGNLTLTSSPDAAYYRLYGSTNLTPPALWTPVTNAPSVSANQWTVTLLHATNRACLYRLQQ